MQDIRIKIDSTELKELIRQYPEISRQVREEKIWEALLLLERGVKEGTPVGAGPIHLRDTFFSDVQMFGQKVHGIMGTPAQHGEPVELGTKPHFPPVGPLLHWVERKLGLSGKEAKSAAFLIARAISRRGTQGAKMVEKAFEKNESRVVEILTGIAPEIVRRVS